jgi:hypothetical protein
MIRAPSTKQADGRGHTYEKNPPGGGHQERRSFRVNATPTTHISRKAANFLGEPNQRHRQEKAEGALGDIRVRAFGLDKHGDDVAASDEGRNELRNSDSHVQRNQCLTLKLISGGPWTLRHHWIRSAV